jgi:hypothetical protein
MALFEKIEYVCGIPGFDDACDSLQASISAFVSRSRTVLLQEELADVPVPLKLSARLRGRPGEFE